MYIILGRKRLRRKRFGMETSTFDDDWAKNVTSRVHVIQLTGTIFELNSHIKETNVLTKFHENWAKNVTSRVFTCFHYIHIEKNAPPTGGHVFSPIWTIFALVRDINKTNVLTNFHDDWAKIVTSRVFTRKTAPPTGSHTNILTNFKLDRDFIGTKLLTKFYEDRTINVASIVFTNKCGRKDGRRTKTGHESSPEQSDKNCTLQHNFYLLSVFESITQLLQCFVIQVQFALSQQVHGAESLLNYSSAF
ncbi:hypothetical protein DPMN_151721 [Dreissena polymorpha]|uniref:Uncharacterized protein n=1 Tax=Dreissena polymorpha TaxID=45954 RepID=A0A9D4FK27_DREPO|nr:hypothetical protein DPMN_151721 [Dreissena polymorpha]